MSNGIITSLIGIIAALLGAWAGSAISRRSANDILRKQEFNQAAAKFRAAFAPAQVEISRRRELGNVKLREFFSKAFLAHAVAIEEFRPFASDASAYQKACEEYKKTLFDDDDLGDANLRWSSNMLFTAGIESHQDFVIYLLRKIEDILYFASPMK